MLWGGLIGWLYLLNLQRVTNQRTLAALLGRRAAGAAADPRAPGQGARRGRSRHGGARAVGRACALPG
ncbi:hypothetical protein LP420_14405 [Massilia sp. B-10]|nr:hypothetical protein LP420_14405 [Massilia sp. B-10]